MNRAAVASDLVAIAKLLSASPMEYVDPSTQTTRWAKKTLMLTLGVDLSAKQIFEQFLTFQEGSSNKFHYFGAFRLKDGTCVGGNAYGRIGYNPKAIEVARGTDGYVISNLRQKMIDKTRKGYQVTEV